MKIAYFDCYSGISGDMTLGAIVANGISIETLSNELSKLKLSGYELKATPIIKKGISAIKVDVLVHEKQNFRHLPQINKIIDESTLDDSIKEKSKKIFQRLGEAEAKVHGIPLEKVHFHEVGAMDSIIDIIGSVAGLHLLGIEKIYSSPLNLGSGTVKTEHGIIPVPAPATVELCKGIPTYSTDIEKELVTPTGATLITTLASGFNSIPSMTIQSVGYGAGNADLPTQANVLRLIIGETTDSVKTDIVTVIETNIDDLNPQSYEHIMGQLLNAGALDTYFVPIHMKKNRPGILFTILANPKDSDKLVNILFSETSTLGIRTYQTTRTILDREIISVATPYGNIQIKIGKRNGKILTVTPEYEDCKKIANEKNIPLKLVQQSALQEYYKSHN